MNRTLSLVACLAACATACDRSTPATTLIPDSVSPTGPAPMDDTPASTATPATPTTTTCDAIVQRFHAARASAKNACSADSDCGCFNGVDPAATCGGVTDGTTAAALAAIEDDFHRSDCKLKSQCAPWACQPKCVQGSCMR